MANKLVVMLIDDDEIDREYVLRLFQKHNLMNNLTFAKDGYEAYSRLKGINEFTKEDAPDLILLDINMPRMNGIEFLEAIRKETEFLKTKIVMLSTSERQEDKLKTSEYNVEKYVVKPIQFEDIEPILQKIELQEGMPND